MRDRRAGNSSATRLLWVAGSMVSVLFIVAVSYAYYGERGAVSTPSKTSPETFAVESAREAIAEMDTDGDSIPDWEEVLWGTDPQKADTDGDGTPDSRAARSAVAWQSAYEAGATSTRTASGTDNTTTIAAREIFGTYLAGMSQNNSADLSPEEQAVIIEQTIRAVQESFKPPTISVDDLRIVAPSSETRRVYTTEMFGIFNDLLAGAHYDYELMRDLTTERRGAALEELEQSVALYTKTTERLSQISVPEDTASNHRALVSAFMGYTFMVDSIRNMERDPVRASAAVNLILQYDEVLASTINEFERYAVLYGGEKQ